MARPQRSTRDAWLDQFADWPPETQEAMLDILQLIHRQTVRRTLRGLETKANGQPAVDSGGQMILVFLALALGAPYWAWRIARRTEDALRWEQDSIRRRMKRCGIK